MRPVTQRLTADGFYTHEHQMPAIQYRDRKQIDQAQIDRKHGHEEEELQSALLCRLPGHLGNRDRSTQVLEVAFADQ